MPPDRESIDSSLSSSPSPRRSVGWLRKGIFSLVFAIFIAGGLYFGYIFVGTTISLVSGRPAPAPINFLPANPFQPAPSPTAVAVKEASPLPDWKSQDRLNILLMGIDQREDERGQPSRTDTMIVLTIDPIAKDAAMLSIPRDLWVVIPGHGENKINTAHFFGEWDKAGSGPALAKKTVEITFGIQVPYYARVDFGGFEKLIDAVGGITVDVPRPIEDDEYPDGDYGIRRIYIPAGIQHMDGRVALEYARTRHGDNDFGRGQRQLQVLLAAKAQAVRLDLLPKLPSLLGVIRDSTSTDLPLGDVPALLNLVRQIDSKKVTARAIDWSAINDLYGDGSILMPRWDVIRPLVAELFADPRFKAEAATIAVENGTQRDGLAAKMGGVLNANGYIVRGVAQSRGDYEETLIVDHTGKPRTVQKLAELLHVPKRNIRSEPGGNTDITIILGLDANVP